MFSVSFIIYDGLFSIQSLVAKTATATERSFFLFPTDKRLSKWLKFCRRADYKFAEEVTKAKAGEKNNLRMCSAHFYPSTYRKTLRGIRKTNGTALPTIFQPNEERKPRKVRYETVIKMT